MAEKFFEYECIVDHRVMPDGTLEFLTKWKGYPSSENTWEPYNSFSFDLEPVKKYLATPDRTSKKSDALNIYPEKIVDIVKASGSNELIGMVQCRECSELKKIPMKIMNIRYPQMVIKFYEGSIQWSKLEDD